ncbi:MAG: class I SAM-dependent methyltransferase [Syntrophorhabdus sp.]|nr:class I SAM-dependent methyltransferase [Syntrophorhabdus sp.]
METAENKRLESQGALLVDKNAPGTQEKVVSILAGMPRGMLLDAPAGEGALVQRLMGTHDITAVDLDADFFRLHGQVAFKQVDLNGVLPFADSSFDYVTCVEGIEHLENPFLCVREFARVLRPGGTLVITTPNIMSIKSRTRFLFYGYHDFFRFIKLPREFRHGHPEYDHQHINPMTFTELRYALEKAGLEVTRVHTNRYVRARRWSALYPLLRRIITKKMKSKAPGDKDFFSREVLEGEIIIVEAEKGRDVHGG